jgi:hypothetical protein
MVSIVATSLRWWVGDVLQQAAEGQTVRLALGVLEVDDARPEVARLGDELANARAGDLFRLRDFALARPVRAPGRNRRWSST